MKARSNSYLCSYFLTLAASSFITILQLINRISTSINPFLNHQLPLMKTRFFNIRKLGAKLLSGFALVSCFAMSSLAQTNIANYTFSQSTGTYTPITGGTVFIAANTPFDQEISSAITIPSFNFGGTSVTTMYIAANGYITFGGTPATTNYTPLSTTGTNITGVIAGLAADLGYNAANSTTGATSEIRHQQVGNEYIIQYADVKRWNSTNERISFQIRLNTATGQIKIVYGGPIVIGTSTSSPQIGVRGNSITYASNVNNVMTGNVPAATTCNWSDAVTGYDNGSTFYMNSANAAVAPIAGLTYTWTPGTQAPVRTFTAVTAITTNSATINFTAPSGATTYNARYRILGTCNWTAATGNPYTGTAVTLTGLTPGSTYQVQVQALNGTASSIWSHIPNTAGTGNGYTTSGTFTTTPTCFVPTALSSNTVLNTSAAIKWNAPTTAIPANGYEYYVSTTNTAPTGATTPTGNTTDTFKALTNLAPSTQYYVWVRSNCGANDKSAWTSSINFTTLPSCVVPTAFTYVANSATNNGATIKWNKPVVIPANGYEYYVSTTNTAPTGSTTPTGTTTDSFKVITGLPPATLHYVWVRSNCGATDKSTWTSSASFTTLCGTPAPGATIASNSTNICAGAVVNFSLTTVPTGPGLSYLWQSSLDGVNYINITGATASTLSTNVYALFYRCRVVCSGGPDTVYSTPVQLNYANNVATVTGAQRCGAGSVILNATANTGSIINWYDVATGGTSLGSGSSFTTPVVANTTSFYAEASVISSGSAIVGAGATTSATYPNPFYSNWSNSHNQYLITASELQASGLNAGNITSLGIKINSGTTALQDFSIKMAPTNATNVSAFLAPAFVSVYSAATITPVVGINTLTFTTPFPWDGTSNIVIEICQGNSATTATVSSTAEADNTSYVSTIHVHKTSGTSGTNVCTDITSNITTYSVRPRFFFNGQVACASLRQVATATINTAPTFTITNNKTVCNNGITPLTVTSTQSSYNNVTWSPATGLFTDAAATVPYVANTHAYTVYHKSNVIGSEDYIATAQNTITLCGGIDTIKVQVIPPAITAIATPGVLCTSGSSVIKINPVIPQTGELYQWQSSNDNVTFTNIGTVASTDTLATGNLTATKYFRAIVKNSDSTNCFNSTSDTVLVNTPAITSATPASRCGIGTVILQAVANSGAVVNWYTAASGGTSVATGNSFTTPVLTANTNYYVSADIINSIQVAGARPAPTSTSNTTPSDYGLVFNANRSFTLNSVEVYNNGAAGTVTVRLVNSGGTVLQTLSAFNVPAGNGTTPFTVPLNFPVPQGTDFRLMAQSGTASLVREGSIGGFPYPVGNVATVTNGYISGNSTTYYYFYNWKVTQSDTCASPRQAVAVTINPAPAFDITNDKTVCNNAATALSINTGGNSYDSVTWAPVTNLYINAAATTPYVAGTHAATVYYKNATAGLAMITANANNTTTHCVNIDTVKIQTLPASIAALADPGLVCESGTAVLKYSPAISQTGFTQQWSGASDNINFTDINGANSATYTTPTLTDTRYYRITVKNSDGATCMTSTDTVKVLHPQITQTVAAERCGPGILTLNATAIDGVPGWYAAATGGTPLASGNNFTTPSINNTTTYYVGAGSSKNDTITVGSGTTTSSGFPNPYNKAWGGNRHQYLITAQELTAAGLAAGQIKGLALDIVSISTSGTVAQRTLNDLTIKLGSTANTTMAGGFVATTGLQTVYNNAGYLPTATGWNYLNFSNAYSWDGISNLVVEFTNNSGNSGGGGAHTIRMSSTSYPATFARWADNVTPATAAEFMVTTTTSGSSNSYSTRANMRFAMNILCEGARTPVTATIKDNPTATLTPDGNINLCDGETQTLTASGGTGAYTWLKNNTIVTGQTANTLAVTQAAPYNVIVTGTNGCTDTSAVANITIVPKPVVNLGNDTAVCANETLQLNAANPGATYQWSNNSTTQTIDVNTPGQYTVTVTNNFNCIARDTITVTHLAFPVVDLGADTVICPSQPLTLNAENTGAAYLWNNGSTTQTIMVNQAGPYAVTVTNAANCVGTDTINVSLVPPIVNNGFDFEPLFNIQPGRVRFTPVDLDPNYTYSWDFGDGSTANQAIIEHDYSTSGNYVVKLTVSDGCAESMENLEIYVDRFTSVTRVKAADLVVKIYPNPANSVLNVALESENTYINKLSIFNMIGQQVTTIIPENKNTKQQSVQLNNLASGAYLIKIETDKGTVNRKFELVK
ncbi:MAG: T9SS type A sorting domain-containing protein [Sphingobacteriales bacterium]|nr:MAG: T9SS type A sorting domain-containing protein [Sphingobacteriales bacterium]